MQVDPTFRSASGTPRVALLKHSSEQIAERRRIVAADADREVEPFEAERRTAPRLLGRAGQVIAAAAVGIDQRFVGLGDLPKLRLGLAIARVDVGMIPTRQPLVRTLDVGDRRAALNAENYVEVHRSLRTSDFVLQTYVITVSPRPPPRRRSR